MNEFEGVGRNLKEFEGFEGILRNLNEF